MDEPKPGAKQTHHGAGDRGAAAGPGADHQGVRRGGGSPGTGDSQPRRLLRHDCRARQLGQCRRVRQVPLPGLQRPARWPWRPPPCSPSTTPRRSSPTCWCWASRSRASPRTSWRSWRKRGGRARSRPQSPLTRAPPCRAGGPRPPAPDGNGEGRGRHQDLHRVPCRARRHLGSASGRTGSARKRWPRLPEQAERTIAASTPRRGCPGGAIPLHEPLRRDQPGILLRRWQWRSR